MNFESILDGLKFVVPFAAAALSGLAAIVGALVAFNAFRRGERGGRPWTLNFDRSDASEEKAPDESKAETGFRQYVLLREYHEQGLASGSVSRLLLLALLLSPWLSLYSFKLPKRMVACLWAPESRSSRLSAGR
jgi:hypothetical protein